uniref:major capsid protein n=1 Tax=Yoonia sp. TaxID=2212373 RepID=UPI00404838E6
RPEYLGGGQSMVNIAPVAQTSSTDVTSPQGNLSGFGTVTATGHGFTKSFTEHCVLLGLVQVRADLTYQQGLNRMFSRSTRYDFYWPAFAHIGEQPIYNKEIFTAGSATDNGVFGYQERYAEYRYKPSVITGAFRSNAATTLDSWHLSQDFPSVPALNSTFIQDDPPVSRVVAIPSEPEFLFDSWFDLKSVRPMPVYSVPGLIDHF